MKNKLSRRQFIGKSFSTGAALALFRTIPEFAFKATSEMKLGLVTYMWAADWDLPTLISNCENAGYAGVELRTGHAHKVETNLSVVQRIEVRKRFADSPVKCVGYGSNFEFHSQDQKVLRQNIEQTKEYIKLCKDIGATGIKVKPNYLPPEVTRARTIAQIAASLNECGIFARDYAQIIRVECHGNKTEDIANMKAIFDQVTERNVKICWNSNNVDLSPPGLEANFNSVKKYIGDTVHVNELNSGKYPYQQLFELFAGIKYNGWILLETTTEPKDRVAAMKEQLALFNQMIALLKKK